MSGTNNDDLPVLLPALVYQDLYSVESGVANTPGGMSTNDNDSHSPPRLEPHTFLPEYGTVNGGSADFLGLPSTVNYTFGPPISNAAQLEKLQVIVEPKMHQRIRYGNEIDRDQGRSNRFIRSDSNDKRYEYPTIKIPQSWLHPDRHLFIRVTMVTVTSHQVPNHYIHPYEIDTADNDVIKDPNSNSIYYRINQNEFNTGEKSFRIAVKKKKQDELKLVNQLYPSDYNENPIFNIEHPQDAKEQIRFYQLWRCFFLFTIAERQFNTPHPDPILHTSVISNMVIDNTVEGPNSAINHSNGTPINTIKCIPQKGDWNGGDEVVIIMSNVIKNREYSVSFFFSHNNQHVRVETQSIDTKTILFRTPSCSALLGDHDVSAVITLFENRTILQNFDFTYLAPRTTTYNQCPRCSIITTTLNASNKRIRFDPFFEEDGGEKLSQIMNSLSLVKTTTVEPTSTAEHGTASISPSPTEESKYEKYLKQLKEALAIFVRTNDPSRLFRRMRVLLSKVQSHPPPLNEAIQNGHVELALSLIQQVIDMSPQTGLLEMMSEDGETPLLVAAKYNHWKLIKTILEKRSELAKQKDEDGNNLFHFLGKLNEDKGAETIKNVSGILSDDMRMYLLKEKNKNDQTAKDIAQSHGNIQCVELLTAS